MRYSTVGKYEYTVQVQPRYFSTRTDRTVNNTRLFGKRISYINNEMSKSADLFTLLQCIGIEDICLPK